jgi:hypothetical protein
VQGIANNKAGHEAIHIFQGMEELYAARIQAVEDLQGQSHISTLLDLVPVCVCNMVSLRTRQPIPNAVLDQEHGVADSC